MADALALAAGAALVELAPATGGAIASFTLDGVDALRPTPPRARAAGEVRAHACYPLVPCSNRIANARLVFAGREHALARNFGDSPHAIHGVGWQRPWTVEFAEAGFARLAHEHDARGETANAWPWPFRSTQTVSLVAGDTEAVLVARLALRNTGDEAFPFGLGWHPFFPLDPDTTLAFAAAHVWDNDATQIPLARRAVGAAERFEPPRRLAGTTLDHVFEPATGTATITWPSRGLAVTIEADRALDRRVVFTPADRPDFAFEPVSHMTDAFNRFARGEPDTGTRVLGPGQAFSCTMRLRVRRTGTPADRHATRPRAP